MAALGLDVPFLRQLVGLAFIVLVPGLLILRVLRFRNLGSVDTLLYAAGLSVTLVMFLGLFTNAVYPALGIDRPIAALPVSITLALVIVILSALAYLRERREPRAPVSRRPSALREALSPPVLLLLLLPIISVLGAYLVNAYANNVLLLVLMGLIALVAVMIGLNRFITPRLYPLAIFMISLSLLWHWSLISGYLWGYDIHHEYYYQSQVLANGVWNPDIRSNINSMLSVVMLAPISSLILGMDPIWIFKIIYPLFFALLPLALFQVFRRQGDDRLGFMAAFLFVSFSAFFADLSQLPRQQVAELFFGLFFMALFDTMMTDGKKRLLLIVFGMAIVVSHYGLAYFFLFYLILSGLFLFLLRNRYLNRRRDSPAPNFAGGTAEGPPEAASAVSLTMTMVFLMIVFCFAWYMYIGRGAPFSSIVTIGVNTMSSLKDIFVTESREAGALMAVGLSAPDVISVQRYVFLVLQYLIEFFILVGIAGVTLKMIRSRFQPLFVSMSLVSLLLLAMCLVLPRFSTNFNISRFYHIALMFLSPYCVLGGATVLRWLYRLATLMRGPHPTAGPVFLNIIGLLILVPYFLFNTGAVYAITGDKVTSMPLNPNLDTPRYNAMEISARKWLQANITGGRGVLADYYGVTWLIAPEFKTETCWGDTEHVPDNFYIYLKTMNTEQGLIMASDKGPRTYINIADSAFGQQVLPSRSRIYDAGGAQVYDVARPGER